MWLFIERVGKAETSLVCCVWGLRGQAVGDVLLLTAEAERGIPGQN